jgi:hypothetical protein
MDEEIEKAVEVFFAHPEGGQENILAALANCGIAPPVGWRLYQFVPMAFCHVVLRPHGVQFAPDYLSLHPDTKVQQQHPLAGEPLYLAAVRVAERLLASGCDPRQLHPVYRQSAEYAVINDLLGGGGQLRDLVLCEPILFEFVE